MYRLILFFTLLLQFAWMPAQQLTRIPLSMLERDFVAATQIEQVSHPWNQGKIRVCRGLRIYQPRLTRLSIVKDSLCIQGIDDRWHPAAVMLPITQKKSNAVYVDLTPYFKSIQKGVDPICGRINPGELENSEVTYRDNRFGQLEASVDYSYRTDSVPYRITVRKSLVLLPEKPMQSRPSDSRLNFRSEVKGCIDRFDISRQKQIVFYIDDRFPALWQNAIRLGIEDWNRAFATIGRPKQIKAVPFSQAGRKFDPFRFGTNVFFCVDSEFANAEGKHYCDPRSGEILQANVLFYSQVISRLKMWYFLQTAAYNGDARHELSDSILQRIIRYAAAHEIGHCLGLDHNFHASFAYDTDSLRSPGFCERYGTTPSIMDYARFNYVAQPGDGVTQVCPPLLGEYDIYSIQAGYKPFADEADFKAFVDQHQQEQIYRYKKQTKGADYDAVPIDVQHSDLGNDMVSSTRYGISNLRYIMNHIADWNPGHTDSFEGMPASFSDLQKYYFEQLSHLLPGKNRPAHRAMLFRELNEGYRFLIQPENTPDTTLNRTNRQANHKLESERQRMLRLLEDNPMPTAGLWLPDQISSGEVFRKLCNDGLQLSAADINSINQACLNNAILSISQDGGTFSPTATASFVSADGLVLTNFHPIRRYLERLSSAEHDYLRYGCYASAQEQEAPLFGLQLNQLLWCMDVTDTLKIGLSETLSISDRIAELSRRAEEWMKQQPKTAKESFRAYSMMGGTQFIVAKYRIFNDVRIVAAPPVSVAMEGGDEVNWRWPRVSCDYAFLRVYSNPNNKPANYRKTNVPYHPERYLTIAGEEVKKGDPVLVAGFPSQTRKNIPWFALENIVNNDTRVRAEITKAKIDYLTALKAKAPAEQQAGYASRISSINNTYLRSLGEIEGTRRDHIIELRKEKDQALQRWIEASPDRMQKYGKSLLSDMEENYRVLTHFNHMEEVFGQCVLSGPNVFAFAGKFEKLINIDKANRKNRVRDMQNELKDLRRNIGEFFEAFNYEEDLGLMKLLLPYYLREMNESYIEESIRRTNNLDSLYANSLLTDSTRLKQFIANVTETGTKALQEDGLYRFCLTFYINRVSRINRDAIPFRRRNGDLFNIYMHAWQEFCQGQQQEADANKTLRYSPGRVTDFSHKNGVPMFCCFTSNAETASGNSGSPVLNAKGELVGVNFDREMSGLSSVYLSNPDTNCNIMVNIHYILYLVKKTPSRYILKELNYSL
ncbi:MAG: S46 family peptidase [Bacteroidales bacterium]|nr:S46 family peptidase [Bacteroidales bacterium]